MAEFQRSRDKEHLASHLAKLGLEAGPDLFERRAAHDLGPGATTPSSWAEIPTIDSAPNYESAEPAGAVPTEPLEGEDDPRD